MDQIENQKCSVGLGSCKNIAIHRATKSSEEMWGAPYYWCDEHDLFKDPQKALARFAELGKQIYDLNEKLKKEKK